MQYRKPRRVRLLWLVSLSLLLSSCGAQWHLKRAIAKDPALAQDTVVRIDTTIITEAVALHDTVTIKEVDTITIIKDGVVVDIQRYYDTLLVDVQCPPDTITVYKEQKVQQVFTEPATKDKAFWGAIGFIGALILIRIAGQVIK